MSFSLRSLLLLLWEWEKPGLFENAERDTSNCRTICLFFLRLPLSRLWRQFYVSFVVRHKSPRLNCCLPCKSRESVSRENRVKIENEFKLFFSSPVKLISLILICWERRQQQRQQECVATTERKIYIIRRKIRTGLQSSHRLKFTKLATEFIGQTIAESWVGKKRKCEKLCVEMSCLKIKNQFMKMSEIVCALCGRRLMKAASCELLCVDGD